MVQVSLTMVVRPRQRAEMIQALRSLMLPLQAAPGFVACRLSQEADDADTICYGEEWQTAEDLDRQIRWNQYFRSWSLGGEIQAAGAPYIWTITWPEVDARFRPASHRAGWQLIRSTCIPGDR